MDSATKELKKKMRRILFHILASTTGEKNNLWSWLYRDELNAKLLEFGFKKLKHEFNNKQVWVNKELNLVFKASFVSSYEPPAYRPLRAVPTIAVSKFNGQNSPDTFWMMQPLVDRSDRAIQIINDFFDIYYQLSPESRRDMVKEYGFDIADRNLGLWNGELVSFDW